MPQPSSSRHSAVLAVRHSGATAREGGSPGNAGAVSGKSRNPVWNSIPFVECLASLTFQRPSKLLARDYRPHGRFPVVDQGQELIAGWSDDETLVLSQGLPYVIFGDHTRAFKFVDFPFVLGADGTQLLKPSEDLNPRFFYYACLNLDIPNRGYNRHFALLKENELPIPPLPEQQKIAAVLWKVQRAIATQDRLIAATRDFKASAMQHLFTHGLHGEPLKQTEIGPMPESWEVVPLGKHLSLAQYGLSIRGRQAGKYPILRMNCQVEGQTVFRDLQFVDLDDKTAANFLIKDGDLLFNRTNSFELVGRTAIFRSERKAVFASYLIRLSLDTYELRPEFVNYYFNQPAVQTDLKRLASRGVSQSNISASKLKEYLIPKASLEEQRAITNALAAIDRKLAHHQKKRAALNDLFQTLLHKLMTAAIRVADLEIDTREVLAQTTQGETS